MNAGSTGGLRWI